MLIDQFKFWRICQGDTLAFRFIYFKYKNLFCDLANCLCPEPIQAEKAVLESFISLSKLKKMPMTSPRFWLTKKLLENIRKHHRIDNFQQNQDQYSKIDAFTIEQFSKGHIEANELKSIIQLLPHNQLESVVLKLKTNLNFTVIGKLQQVSSGTAASRYEYGIETILSKLNGESL